MSEHRKVHELKCRTEFFEDLYTCQKPFEIRKNDRDFKVGDDLYLREYKANGKYTGRSVTAEVLYVLKNSDEFKFLIDNYVCLGINVYIWEDESELAMRNVN